MNDQPSRLGYEVYDGRPALVLLHAFPFDRRLWRPQVEALADLATVITVDLPGFGESASVAAPASLDDWADRVDRLLDELVGAAPVVVGGLSMGGYVALRLAHRHPERLEALILADTRAAADSPEGRTRRDEAIRQVREEGLAAFVDSVLPGLLSNHAEPDVIEQAREIARAQPAAAVASALAAMRDRPDSTVVLPRVRVPALVVVGSEDALTPPDEAEAMARMLPSSWLVKIAGAGHLSSLEAPDEFTAAVTGFLAAL